VLIHSDQIQLLAEAVKKCAASTGSYQISLLPWNGIAEYVSDRGGSHKFSNANCKKKWVELQQLAKHRKVSKIRESESEQELAGGTTESLTAT
jgi:hypothetical protein